MIAIIVIAVVVVVALAGVAYYAQMQRRRRLEDRFGPEYQRTLHGADNRRDAERELLARQKRHDQLDIKPLDPGRAEDYRAGWERAQARFVDQPVEALEDADALIEAVMGERGYPVGDFDSRLSDLSVEHADVLQHYRAAHAITSAARDGDDGDTVDTEQLRRGLLHYRELFTALLTTHEDQPHRESA